MEQCCQVGPESGPFGPAFSGMSAFGPVQKVVRFHCPVLESLVRMLFGQLVSWKSCKNAEFFMFLALNNYFKKFGLRRGSCFNSSHSRYAFADWMPLGWPVTGLFGSKFQPLVSK